MRISVSGIDASGKTTLSRKLNDWLQNKNFKTKLFNIEPKAYKKEIVSPVDIDDWRLSSFFFNSCKLLDGNPGFARDRFSPRYVDYIMILEEVFAYKRLVIEKEKKGVLVIHDRHLLDREAAAIAAGCPKKEINQIVAQIPKPDITFFLDLPVKVAQERMKLIRKRIDPDEVEEKQIFLYQAYKQLINKYSHITVLDANMPLNNVFENAKIKLKTIINTLD